MVQSAGGSAAGGAISAGAPGAGAATAGGAGAGAGGVAGATSVGGAPTYAPALVAASQDGPNAIACDSAFVYWVDAVSFKYMRKAIAAAAPPDDITPAPFSYELRGGVTVDSSGVFWSSFQQVWQSPPGGGAVTLLADGASSLEAIVSTSDTVFVRRSKFVSRYSKVAPANEVPIVQDDRLGFNAPHTLTITAGHLYFTTNDGGNLWTSGLDGSNFASISSTESAPGGIASDASEVFWVNEGTSPDFADGALRSLTVNTGKISTVLDRQLSPYDIVVDASYLYWVSRGTPPSYTDGAVYRVKRSGGSAELIAGNQAQPRALALCAGMLYWANYGAWDASSDPDAPVYTAQSGEVWSVVLAP